MKAKKVTKCLMVATAFVVIFVATPGLHNVTLAQECVPVQVGTAGPGLKCTNPVKFSVDTGVCPAGYTCPTKDFTFVLLPQKTEGGGSLNRESFTSGDVVAIPTFSWIILGKDPKPLTYDMRFQNPLPQLKNEGLSATTAVTGNVCKGDAQVSDDHKFGTFTGSIMPPNIKQSAPECSIKITFTALRIHGSSLPTANPAGQQGNLKKDNPTQIPVG